MTHLALSVVVAVRWATLTVALLLAATTSGTERATYGVILLGHGLWRTARPGREDRADLVATSLDIALHLTVVLSTGGWRSPFIITMVGPILAMARAQGAQRLAAEREEHTRGRLAALTEANTLLSELHRVAQTLPVSLDLHDTVESTMARAKELFEPNSMALLLLDESSQTWAVAASAGVRLPSVLSSGDLPTPVAAAVSSPATRRFATLPSATPGLSRASSTGLYAPLRTRDRLVGVLAVERVVPGTLHERDRELMQGLAEQAAIALDNARWFARLRRAGAEEERRRIARDLHDRVGQALAYTAFELDRIARSVENESVREELQTLRSDTRQILGEVRETLSDLRADVSEDHDLIATVDSFLSRVRRRSDLEVAFEHGGTSRLPLPIEREMWRIAQEAVTNAERHAKASRLEVRWTCADDGALLEVVDDGAGIPELPVRPGAYGLVGMRERAEAIGANLEIDSAAGTGTTVRCRFEAA